VSVIIGEIPLSENLSAIFLLQACDRKKLFVRFEKSLSAIFKKSLSISENPLKESAPSRPTQHLV
jgi:hypothetical protein